MRDFRSNLKIIKYISGSTCGSSLVALGSSWVAVGVGQNGTATTFYSFKSISYKKGSRIALVFIQAHKTRFLPLFSTFLTTKNTLVAVDFSLKIFSFQVVSIDKKCNCYHRFYLQDLPGFEGYDLFMAGTLSVFYDIENRLYMVVSKFVEFGFIGLIMKGLSGLCDGSRLGVLL